jgi:hypothetical protein
VEKGASGGGASLDSFRPMALALSLNLGAVSLTRFHSNSDCSALLSSYVHIGKGGNANYFYPVQGQKAGGNCNSFQCLIDGSSANSLDLGPTMLANDPGDRSSDRCRLGSGGDSYHVYHCQLLLDLATDQGINLRYAMCLGAATVLLTCKLRTEEIPR